MLYPPPIQCQNYSSSHYSETDRPNQKQKKNIFNYIFLHLDKHLWLKDQNTNGRKSPHNFLHVQNLHLTAHKTAHW